MRWCVALALVVVVLVVMTLAGGVPSASPPPAPTNPRPFAILPPMTLAPLAALAVTLALASPALAADTKAPATAPAAPAPAGKTITMTVTDKGFEPANLTVKKGVPVTLAITRKTDHTCATEIVIDEEGIKTPLPLNETVKVTFTPKKAGTLKYGCAMGKMIGGVLKVE